MQVQSIGFSNNSSSSRAGGTVAQPSTSAFWLDHNLSCLQAGKAYLDAILAIPAMHYRLLSFVEWMRLLRVVAIICKLCIPSNHYTDIHWDHRMAQERVRVDLYLESLCYRVQSLTMFDKRSQRLGDIWILLKGLLERIRSWYTGRIRLSPEEVATAKDTDVLPLGPAMRPQVATNGYEAQNSAVAATAKFWEMDRMMNDFENSFWVSKLFDMGMRVLVKG